MHHVMKYRPEIDGLRAIALIPVILFHAGFKTFSGGFVGVDVFFVISGYLITKIILAEKQTNTFSIINFYERRARRILPALFLVMFACLPFAWFWLSPPDLKAFSDSLIAVSIFVSNLLFWRTSSSYFTTNSELMPLIHTWSLAVEEQYYVFFPIFLMLIWNLGRRTIFALFIILALLSLSIAQWGTVNQPIASYYLLSTRGWEILIGAFIAFRDFKEINHKQLTQLGSLSGFSLIAYAIFTFDEHTPFPSIYTLLPTIGAALILIFARQKTIVGKLLSTKVFLNIGLISYSTYLWHQPLFAFARHRSLSEPSPLLMLTLSLASLGFGYLSWQFVERPFRNRHRFSRQQVFFYGAICSFLFIAIGSIGHIFKGNLNNERWNKIQNIIESKNEIGSGEKYCLDRKIDFEQGIDACLIGDTKVKPDGVLWGDSYASTLLYGLNNQLLQKGHSFYAVLGDGCVPIAGLSRMDHALQCIEERHTNIINTILNNPDLHNIVWIGKFAYALRQPSEFLIDGSPLTPQIVRTKINETLNRFRNAGKKVIFIGDTPVFQHPVADYALKLYTITNADLSETAQFTNKQEQYSQYGNLSEILEDARSKAIVIDGLDVFCKQDHCSSHDENGLLLFSDKNHLSHLGSNILSKIVADKLYVNQ